MTQQHSVRRSKTPLAIDRRSAIRMAIVLMDMAALAVRLESYDYAESMRLAAQALCPEETAIETLKPMILLGAGKHREALASLEGCDDSLSLAFRASCMRWLQERSWELLARQVIARNDVSEATTLARRLLEIEGIVVSTDTAGASEAPPPIFFRRGIKA